MSTSILDRLAAVSSTSLADAGKGVLRILPPELRPVRADLRLTGRVITVDATNGLLSVLAGLQQSGPGDVLVVAGSRRHAVAGELFATEALRRGLAGIVIDGMCRDLATLAQLDLPVFARGSVPSALPATALPVTGIPLDVDGVRVDPGDLVVGDADGLVLGSPDELAAVIDTAEAIEQRETVLRERILAGESLFDHLNFDEHVANLRAGLESGLAFS